MGRTTLQVDGFEVERHYIRYIEEELRRYALRRIRLHALEDDIIRGTSELEPGMPRGPGVGNPTANKAMALMRDAELAHLRMWTVGVKEVLSTLGDEQQEIIRHFYFENRLRAEGIAEKMRMHIQGLYRERNRALLAFCIAFIGDHVVIKTVN